MMTRAEHLEWCKKRALALADRGDLREALTSMMSDLGKHAETAGHVGIGLTVMLLMSRNLQTKAEVIEHINGFR